MRNEITKKDFAEFYVLSALSPIIERGETGVHSKLVVYRNTLVMDIIKFYLEHLQEACVQEAQHAECRNWPTSKKHEQRRQRLISIGLSPEKNIDESFLYASEGGKGNSFRSAERLISVFRDLTWSPSYGGPAWARIAELYKELLECRSTLSAIDTTDFNPDNGYDIYTHHNLRLIRKHLDNTIHHNVQKTIHVIDMLHQVEHNTGSIFTKFPGHMTTWLETLLNEKAIAASIQVLREHVGFEVRNTIQELKIPDQLEADVERQLGQVVLARRAVKDVAKYKNQYDEDVAYIEKDYKERLFTRQVYNDKLCTAKTGYRENVEAEKTDAFTYALGEHRSHPRNQRGIIREIIALSENDDSLLTRASTILSHAKERAYADYDMFLLFKDTPKWHDAFISTVAPYYFVIPFKWQREVTDFIFEKFNSLKPNKTLALSTISALYENLIFDGYDSSKLTKPESNAKSADCTCYDCVPRGDKVVMDVKTRNEKAKAFALANVGKPIVGTNNWLLNHVNKFMPLINYVDDEMPIGTVIDYKGSKICFSPSDHWKENGYTENSYEISLTDIELYDESKPKHKTKPRNFKSFANTYAGQQIVFKQGVNPGYDKKLPIGTVIGYATEKHLENHVYYIPSQEFIDAGYSGYKAAAGIIKYTDKNYNDNNVSSVYSAQLNEILPYTDPMNKVVEVHTVSLKPVPPKGGGSPEEFAIKYAGKEIKVTEKYSYYLNMIRPWDSSKSIGKIIGSIERSLTKICFIPSQDFINAGWSGVLNFGGFNCTAEQYKDSPTYYTINWTDIELTDGKYEEQFESTAIETGLTPNKQFAMDYAGKAIVGAFSSWKNFTSVNDEKWNLTNPIGTVVGYKGSVIYYTPSQQLIDAGYDGEVVDGITYTDDSAKGKKCYSLLGTSTILIYNEEKKGKTSFINAGYKTFASKNGGKQFKASTDEWADKTIDYWANLTNTKGESWDMKWPIGTIVGYNKAAHSVCYTPSKKLIGFGYPGILTSKQIDFTNYSAATDVVPYYETTIFKCLEVLVTKKDKIKSPTYSQAKPENSIPNGVFSKLFAGKKVKKTKNNIDGWDKNKVIGTVVGYKTATDSIIWQATDEYSALNPGKPIHSSGEITFAAYDKRMGFHSCFASSLEVCDTELTTEQAAAVFAIKHAGKGIKAKPGTTLSKITKEPLGYVVGFNLGTSNVLFFPSDELYDAGHGGSTHPAIIPTLETFDPNTGELEAIDVMDIQLEDEREIKPVKLSELPLNPLSEGLKHPEVKPDRFKEWVKRHYEAQPVEMPQEFELTALNNKLDTSGQE